MKKFTAIGAMLLALFLAIFAVNNLVSAQSTTTGSSYFDPTTLLTTNFVSGATNINANFYPIVVTAVASNMQVLVDGVTVSEAQGASYQTLVAKVKPGSVFVFTNVAGSAANFLPTGTNTIWRSNN